MERKIIHIDQDKCNGCGLCVKACHEHAIGLIDGKATLLRDDYCDGLGDCLPHCPTNAITFTIREALPYNEIEVQKNMSKTSFTLKKESGTLSTWPIQIRLAPENSEMYEGKDLLIAADCTAFAYKNFHDEFLGDKACLIGCTKLDPVNYATKLTSIISNHEIKSITVLKMEVPCCNGMMMAVKKAVEASGKDLKIKMHMISTKGKLLK